MSSLLSYPKEKGLYGIFNDSFPPILDGVTLTVENYVYWLMQKGRTPCVVTPWNPVQNDYPYSVLRFFSLPIRSRKPYRYGYPKLDPFIWHRLRNTDFKILHAHCPFSSGRLAVYVKKHQKVPLIGTFHSKYRSDLEHSFKYMPWCVPIIMKRILNFFNACDEVWIPQAYVEETVREYGYKGPLTVVENGNDFASVISGNVWDYKKEARKRIGLPDSTINLLFVGQHIWEKGIGTIVDALELIKNDTDFRMNFVGNGYAFDELGKIIHEKGLEDKVRLNGTVTDRNKLSDFYAASDLFIFPSFYDNAPLVLREAAAMATPSILLEESTASEVITDRRNGFLCRREPAEIAEMIRTLSADRKMLREVALGARNSLVRSWEDVVGEVTDRYDSLIRRRKSM
ncbi:MAG: glycosyltransferase [Muribaculaceae bacterium]|nr:glycosyltransferase [Muribaculaceae bacterium]MDE6755394.1 glycosyltransferase [Muribaculaceae bacterium]